MESTPRLTLNKTGKFCKMRKLTIKQPSPTCTSSNNKFKKQINKHIQNKHCNRVHRSQNLLICCWNNISILQTLSSHHQRCFVSHSIIFQLKRLIKLPNIILLCIYFNLFHIMKNILQEKSRTLGTAQGKT